MTGSTGTAGIVRAWLFDAYPGAEGMVVWFVDEDGHPHRVTADYRPAFYAAGPRRGLDRLRSLLDHQRIQADLTATTRQELFSGADLPVLRVAVHRPLQFAAAVARAARIPGLTLFTCDVSVPQLFFFETGLFPLGQYEIAVRDRAGVGPGGIRGPRGLCHGVLAGWEPLTSPEDMEYDTPPLLVMRLRLDGDPINPNHGWRSLLDVSVEGEHVVLSGERPEDLVQSLARLLQRYDPDVLLTEWGDSFLLPRLLRLSQSVGRPLPLNRDPGAGIRTRRSRSYITYGQTVYQAGARYLHGRWHLDLRNSFIYTESEMAGLFELARLSRLPVQHLARTSTGTAISSMQLHRAVRDGILVPWHKSEPEGFKTAAQLLLTDKGGLTYQPLVGIFEGVGELDFSSMYPTMMARFNISPETVNCTCCADAEPVPEIGHTICHRRRGLVPAVLDHLLERRAYYKQRRQETTGPDRAIYDQRQTALKWCLVTCLDGATVVPVRIDGTAVIAPIHKIIDRYLPDGPGVLPVRGLQAFGYDRHLHPLENPIRYIMKTPAPARLIRIRLEFGAELSMIPAHRCYVVRNDQLIVKRAADLTTGDRVPVTAGPLSLNQLRMKGFHADRPARIRSIESVPSTSPFVYCFEVGKDLRGFLVSEGIFTGNSFGYLGYKNARYGRIEAHESTTAYSREVLLRAKEMAEDRGYRMLHALVDSMWLHKPGAGQAEYERLALDIKALTNLPIFVEGVYRWVAFLPSRLHKGVGVPNRYMGVFEDGNTKVRGIEVRRSDVPGLVEETQAAMLRVLFGADSLDELHARVPEALATLEEAMVRLRGGEVTPGDLALTATLSQEPHEYRSNNVVALTARMMARSGIRLHPGEAVQYVVTDADAKIPDERVRPLALLGTDWSYDEDRYAELLCRAGETVLELLGYTRERLRRELWEPLRAPRV